MGHTVGRALPSASTLSSGKIAVEARFSVGGGDSKASHTNKPERGLALRFTLLKGERWLMEASADWVWLARSAYQVTSVRRWRVPPAEKTLSALWWNQLCAMRCAVTI